MKKNDTSMGGAAGPFPATTWAQVSRHSPDSRRLVEVLCRKYWKPLYQYIRVARPRPNEEAKDRVQAFFLWLLEGDALARFAPERGNFRGYLRMLLKQFVWHEDESRNRLKRGGGATILPLEIVEEAGAAAGTADEAFDKAWRDQVMGAAIDRVRRDCPEAQFRVFEELDIAGSKETYAGIARRLGLTENGVRNALFKVREAVRQEIRAELMETASGPGELEEEWNDLLGK